MLVHGRDNTRKALGQFDQRGRLMRWPVKYSVQKRVIWVLWTRNSDYRKLPARPDDETRALLTAWRAQYRDS